MDISKKINDERWSLSQDENSLQVIIKKDQETILVQNLNYKLDAKKGFNLLSKMPAMKLHRYTSNEMTEEKQNKVEEVVEETTENKIDKIIVPKPHMCKFCGTIPKAIFTTSESNVLRTLKCGCIAKVVNENKETKVVHKRWIYTVDVIDNNIEEADSKLINEWNRRMPE